MNFMEKVRRASKTVVDAGAKQMLKVRFVQQASFSNRNRNRDIVACDSKINIEEEKLLFSRHTTVSIDWWSFSC